MNYPAGINLLVNTSAPLLAALFSPLTWLAGPLASYVLLLELGLALSALSATIVARRLGFGWWGSFLVGSIYGFAANHMTTANSHVFLAFDVVMPWVVFSAVRLLQGSWTARRFGLTAGALICVDFFISTERALIELLVLAAVAVGDLLLHRTTWRARARSLLVAYGWMAGLLVVVLGAPAWYALFGPQSIRGAPRTPSNLPAASLGGLFKPGPYALVAPFGREPESVLAPGDPWVGESYLGLPLLLLGVVAVVRYWRHQIVRGAAALVVVFLVLALGPRITIPFTHVRVRGPEFVLEHLSVLKEIQPSRFMGIVVLLLSLLAATALKGLDLRRVQFRVRTGAAHVLAGLCLLALLPNQGVMAAATTTPAWMSSAAAHAQLPDGSVVLSYPYPIEIFDTPILDQSESGLWYLLIGGQGIVPDATGQNHNVLPLKPTIVFNALFRATQPDPTAPVTGFSFRLGPLPPLDHRTAEDFMRFAKDHDVDEVLWRNFGSNPGLALQYLQLAFGPGRSFDSGQVRIWHLK
jgi:hypothetical protein